MFQNIQNIPNYTNNLFTTLCKSHFTTNHCSTIAPHTASDSLPCVFELLQLELELALLGLVDSVARIYGVIDFSHVRLGTCCGVQVKSGK